MLKQTQKGRSMIEMLGVLAIIGVLSIGGLAGYTRAMRAHRINNILDYVNRCYVEARSYGDGMGAHTVACSDIDTVPAGIDVAEAYSNKCERVSGGKITCMLKIDEDLVSMFQSKTGSTSDTQSQFFNGIGWYDGVASINAEVDAEL